MEPAVIERLDIGDSQAPKGRSVLDDDDVACGSWCSCWDDAILLLLLLLLYLLL
jgi:hypothetical protein